MKRYRFILTNGSGCELETHVVECPEGDTDDYWFTKQLIDFLNTGVILTVGDTIKIEEHDD